MFLYHGSASSAVVHCVPRRRWIEWLFRRVPPEFWQVAGNRRRYVEWLGKKLGIRRPADWLAVGYDDFLHNRGARSLTLFSSHRDNLKESFPQLAWDSLQPRPLTEKQTLAWADANYERHGQAA